MDHKLPIRTIGQQERSCPDWQVQAWLSVVLWSQIKTCPLMFLCN